MKQSRDMQGREHFVSLLVQSLESIREVALYGGIGRAHVGAQWLEAYYGTLTAYQDG